MASTSFPPYSDLSFTGKHTLVPVSDNWLNLIEAGGDYMSIGTNALTKELLGILDTKEQIVEVLLEPLDLSGDP